MMMKGLIIHLQKNENHVSKELGFFCILQFISVDYGLYLLDYMETCEKPSLKDL